MAGIDVIKEYLVGMGFQDNFTESFNKVLNDSQSKMGKFANTFSGKFALAGVAVATATVMANVAVGKFLTNLAQTDLEMDKYAKSIGKTKEEATRLDITLKSMGKTLEEINSNAELKMNFRQLQEDAKKIQLPDMSEGMKQIRDTQLEFIRFKQNATYSLNWIGYYLVKYLKKPISDIQDGFKKLNESFIKNMPKWSEKIAEAMSWIVRLGITLFKGISSVFTALKNIFNMIPKELKIVGAALTGLGILIRAGPIGKLIMIITAALLLLEDFYTYINGGDALLGGFWQKLIDIYNILKDSGAIDKFKDNIQGAFNYANEKIIALKDYLIELFEKFKESGSIEKFIELLKNIKSIISLILVPLSKIGRELLNAFGGKGKDFLDWFVTVALPKALDLLNSLTNTIKNVLTKLNDLGATEGIIKGIAIAFAGWKIKKGLTSSISGISGALEKANKWVSGLDGSFQGLNKKNFSGIAGKLIDLKKNVKSLGETVYLKVSYSKVTTAFKSIGKAGKSALNGIVKTGKSAVSGVVKYGGIAAKGALTGIKTAGTVMAKGIGAAIGFITSPVGLTVLAIGALIAIAYLVIKNWDKVKEFFIGLGEKIKETFGNAIEYAKEKFGEVAEWISQKIEQIKNFFVNLNTDIKELFGSIGDWFKEKATAIVNAFKNIPSALKDKFVNAVNMIKNVFSPLVDWFKGKVDTIKGFFSGIGEKIKETFNPEDNPDPEGNPTKPTPIGHSEGGVFFNKHEAEIAEDGAEAVIPLTKPKRAKEILANIKDFIGFKGNSLDGDTKLYGIKEGLLQMTNVLSNIKSSLREQQNISYTSRNVTINNITISPQSNNKIYGSGNPERTADVINKNTTNSTGLLLRNLQGVI